MYKLNFTSEKKVKFDPWHAGDMPSECHFLRYKD
jgi:hypothetical protein